MGYFAQQSLDLLDPDLTIIEQLQKDFPHEGLGALRTLAGAFQFSGDDVDKKIRALSGGEKSRLVMARMLFDPPNFLVLDGNRSLVDQYDRLRDSEARGLVLDYTLAFKRVIQLRRQEFGAEVRLNRASDDDRTALWRQPPQVS